MTNLDVFTHDRNVRAIAALLRDTYPDAWVIAVPSVLYGHHDVRVIFD